MQKERGRQKNKDIPQARPPKVVERLPKTTSWRSLSSAATLLAISAMLTLFACRSYYTYRAVTDNCNCEEFRLADAANHIGYLFRAKYRMEDGIATSIEIEFSNHNTDTLFLFFGSVRVTSRNVSYQYNNRFVELPFLSVAPGESETVHLTGKDVVEGDDWNKIAGERLSVTVKGIRLGEKTLPEKTVEFIPEDPKLRD